LFDHLVEELDIDADGQISEDDLSTALQRGQYFDEVYFAPCSNTRDFLVVNAPSVKGTVSLNTKALHPFKALPQLKVEQVR